MADTIAGEKVLVKKENTSMVGNYYPKLWVMDLEWDYYEEETADESSWFEEDDLESLYE